MMLHWRRDIFFFWGRDVLCYSCPQRGKSSMVLLTFCPKGQKVSKAYTSLPAERLEEKCSVHVITVR